MSYLRSAIENFNAGERHNLNHIDYILTIEQTRVRNAIKESGFWYVDIPRTSSTFIKVNLASAFGYPYGKGNVADNQKLAGMNSYLLPSHTPGFIVKDVVGERLWRECNTFSVVRNPYSWSLSFWRYTKTYGNLGFSYGSFMDFLDEFAKNTSVRKTERPFFPSNYAQTDYLTAKDSEALLVKNVLKFEDREAIVSFLNKLGMTGFATYEKLVATDSSDYSLDPEEKSAVHRIFERDFDLLGYE